MPKRIRLGDRTDPGRSPPTARRRDPHPRPRCPAGAFTGLQARCNPRRPQCPHHTPTRGQPCIPNSSSSPPNSTSPTSAEPPTTTASCRPPPPPPAATPPRPATPPPRRSRSCAGSAAGFRSRVRARKPRGLRGLSEVPLRGFERRPPPRHTGKSPAAPGTLHRSRPLRTALFGVTTGPSLAHRDAPARCFGLAPRDDPDASPYATPCFPPGSVTSCRAEPSHYDTSRRRWRIGCTSRRPRAKALAGWTNSSTTSSPPAGRRSTVKRPRQIFE
jgi:hypothetical protein